MSHFDLVLIRLLVIVRFDEKELILYFVPRICLQGCTNIGMNKDIRAFKSLPKLNSKFLPFV